MARYTYELLRALAASNPSDEFDVLVPGSGTPSVAELEQARNLHVHHKGLPGWLLHAAAPLGRPRLDRLLGNGADVALVPAPAPIAVSRETPYVLTVHDLSFEQRPADFGAYERLWHRLTRPRRLAERAARVIAVSEDTAAALRERWDVADVSTVPEGVPRLPEPGPGAVDAVRRRHRLRQRFLLFVGALEPRKGPDILVEAYAEARRRDVAADLVLVGAGPLAKQLGGKGVRVLGRIPDEELAALYAGALAVVAPSRLEGFGLVPLEAGRLGTPAVVSDLPAFRETLGDDGALRFHPEDPSELTEALLRIAADGSLRRELAGRARAAGEALTWERAAARTREVLAQAAAG